MTTLDFTIIGKNLSNDVFDKLGKQVDSFSGKLDKLDGRVAKVGIKVDETGAIRSIKATTKELDNFGRAAKKAGDDGSDSLAKLTRGVVALHDGLEILDRVRDRFTGLRVTIEQASDFRTVARNFGLMAGAAAAGALATAGAIGTVPLAFVALGAAAVAQNERVQNAFTNMKDHILQTTADLASPMVEPLVRASQEIIDSFDRVAPELGVIFTEVASHVGTLTEGVTGFVVRVMPGFVDIVKSSYPVIDALATGVANTGEAFGQFLTNISTVAGQAGIALTALFDFINRLLPLLGSLFAAFTNAGAPLLQVLLPAINSLLEVVGGALIQAFTVLGPVFVGVANAIQPLLAAIGNLIANGIMPALVALFTAFGNVVGTLSPILASLLNALTPLIPAIVNLVSPFFPFLDAVIQVAGVLGSALIPILAQLLPVITALATTISALAGQVLIALMNALLPLLPVAAQLITVLAQLAQAVLPILVAAIQPLLPVLSFLANVIGQVLILAVQGLMAVINALGPVFQPLITIIAAATAAVVAFNFAVSINPFVALTIAILAIIGLIIRFRTEIADAFLNVWHAVTGFMTNLAADLAAIWNNIYAFVTGVAANVWHAVSGFFINLWHDVSQWAINLWNELIAHWNNIFIGVTTIATNLWHAVSGFFINLWHEVSQWVINLWNELIAHWNNIFIAVTTIATNLWHAVSGFFINLWHEVVAWAVNLWNELTATWTNIFNTVTGWAANIWHTVSGFFRNMWNEAVMWVANLLNDANSLWDRIWAAVTGFANRIWNDSVAAFVRLKDGAIGVFKDIANFAFRNPINWVIDWVINRGIGGIVRNVGKVIGQNWDVHVDPLPVFATGGTVPGFAPGVDSVHALLSPGEGILVPEAVRMLGGAAGIDSINASATSRVSAKKPGAGRNAPEPLGIKGFALGGVIGDIWGGLKDAGSAIGDAVKGAVNWVRERLADTAQALLNTTVYPIVDRVATPGLFGGVPRDLTHKMGDSLVNFLRVQDDKDRLAREASQRTGSENRGFGPIPSGPVTGNNVDIVRQLAQQMYGWVGPQWDALYALIMKESGFRNTAQNPTSTAYGMFQFLDSTWAGLGVAKTSDPTQQTVAGLRYIASRYGTPSSALAFHNANNWYANGGLVTTPTIAGIGEAGPELILPLNKPNRTNTLLGNAGLGGETSAGADSAPGAGLPSGNPDLIARVEAEYRKLQSTTDELKRSGEGLGRGNTQLQERFSGLANGVRGDYLSAMQAAAQQASVTMPAANNALMASNAQLRADELATSTMTGEQRRAATAATNLSANTQKILNDFLMASNNALRIDEINSAVNTSNQRKAATAATNLSANTQKQLNDFLMASNGVLRTDEINTAVNTSNQRQFATNAVNVSANNQKNLNDFLMGSNAVLRNDETVTSVHTQNEWRIMNDHVQISVDNQNFAQQRLRDAMGVSRVAMTETANWAGVEYGRTYHAAANPIRDVINRPIRGLVDAWNSLNNQFAFNRPVAAPIAGFATGGPVRGPGGPTEDKVPIWASNGEFIVQSSITRKVKPFLAALNAGQTEALQAAGYATGGIVADTGSALNATILRGQQFARAQHGKPYIWGGVGPTGYDCSGFLSAITNVLRGQAAHRRLWSTASFARGAIDGFVNGLTSGWAIGVKQGSPGHMAGTLGGVNAESGGSHGNVAFGPPAVGADHGQFPMKLSLPVVGGAFVPGGGGGIDVGAIVNETFKNINAMNEQVLHQYGAGNIAASHGVGVSREAERRVREIATNSLNAIAGAVSGAIGPVQDAVRAVAQRYGWGGGPQWAALDWIIQKESGWNPNAANPTSSARGLFQKMTSIHGPLEPTVAGQAEWGLNYIKSRYGDPIGAKAFHQSHGYYANGAIIRQKTLAILGEAGPEVILPLHRPGRARQLVNQAGIAGDGTGNITITVPIHVEGNMTPETVDKIEQQLVPRLRLALQQGVGRRNRV